MKFLFFDTETTGLPKDRKIPAVKQKGNWPDIVSIAWILYEDGKMVKSFSSVIRPDGWTIPEEASKIHGISDSFAREHGLPWLTVLQSFYEDLLETDYVVAHNLDFDKNVVDNAVHWRTDEYGDSLDWKKTICTAIAGTGLTKILAKNSRGSYYRFPKLSELYEHVMGKKPTISLHNSMNDTLLLAELFFHLPVYKTLIEPSPVRLTLNLS